MTRWEGHFRDPADAAKELEIEVRLKKEFEDPVNQSARSSFAARMKTEGRLDLIETGTHSIKALSAVGLT